MCLTNVRSNWCEICLKAWLVRNPKFTGCFNLPPIMSQKQPLLGALMMGQFMRKLFRSWPQLSDSLEMEEQRLSQPGWSSKEINVFLVDDINENLTFQSQTIWYKWRRWRIKSFRRYLIVCQRGDWGKMQHQIVESTALSIQYSAQLKITHKVVSSAQHQCSCGSGLIDN